jgi:subtilisin family serine protease
MDERTAFSGSGSALELVAPGRDVPTVIWNSEADGHSLFSGCSAAVPIVSGVATLLKGLDPSLTQADVRLLLQSGAEDQVGRPTEDAPGWDPFHGWGRVNLRRTLESLGVTSAVAGPEAHGLALQVFPNPVRGSGGVRFEIPRTADVTLVVYDVSGRRVRTLVRGPRPAGDHRAIWMPAPGEAPGVYFVRLSTGRESLTRKVTVLR